MTTFSDAIQFKNINYRGTLYDHFPKIYNIYVIGFIACISGLMFGFDISSMSSMIGTSGYKQYFGTPDATKQGGITSAMAAGSFIGSLLSPNFSDAFGRKVSLHICSAFWIIGAIIQCASQNIGMLVAGRFISGIGIGFGSSVAPVYCSEVAPTKIRGTITGLFQLSVTIGIMVLFFIGYGAHFLDGAAAFRVTWGIQIIPGMILLALTFFIPESPRWLANHDRWNEATAIICRVNNTTLDNLTEPVHLQLEEMQEQVSFDKEAADFTYISLFRKKTIRKTIIGMSAQMWQQLCGMNVMMYYIVYVFEMAGYSGNTVLVSGSIQYVLNFLLTIPALFLVEKAGRRPLLIIGGVLMFTWLFAVAGLLAKYSIPTAAGFEGNDTVRIFIPQSNNAASKAVIACCYLFVCSFAPTWGVGIWIYCSEIFNNKERAKGSALSAAINWIFNFCIGMFVPSAFSNITWKTYIVFAVFSVCLTIHTWACFPETKGKTLEEIDQMWADNIPAWKSSEWKPTFIPQVEEDSDEKALREANYVENIQNIGSEKPDVSHLETSSNDNESI